MVRINGSGTHEAVSGVVSQHNLGQCADLGTTVTLERRIEQLAVGVPGGCDERVTASGIVECVCLEMQIDVRGA